MTLIGEVPEVSKDGLKEVWAGTSWNTKVDVSMAVLSHVKYSHSPVVRVVRAHDADDICITYTRLEGRSVVLGEILSIDNSIEAITLVAFPVLDVVRNYIQVSYCRPRLLDRSTYHSACKWQQYEDTYQYPEDPR